MTDSIRPVSGSALNTDVQNYWEAETCGTGETVTAGLEKHSPEWFRAVEDGRYRDEPYIHAVAQFTRHRGKDILEIGVGAGTDHLQWARASCICHGVDLTLAGIDTTTRHLALHGLSSDLRHIDAERLPFDDASMDIVYSWGVIHHSEKPEAIIAEVRRVLKPGGRFIGMLYNRRSVAVARLWLQHGLLAGKPWRSFSDIAWNHIESIGTKVYTVDEVEALFSAFSTVRAWPIVTHSDEHRLPRWIGRWLPAEAGFFIAIHADL
jgi:ubiquinone/menaquinone biosynthesis C-methylase UbiE